MSAPISINNFGRIHVGRQPGSNQREPFNHRKIIRPDIVVTGCGTTTPAAPISINTPNYSQSANVDTVRPLSYTPSRRTARARGGGRRSRLRASDSCCREFSDEYELTDGPDAILGEGAYAIVRIAEHRRTKQKYAVKVIDRSDPNHTRDKCFNELRLLNACNGHPNILQLHEYYEDSKYFYMVFEYVQGGNLASQLQSRGGSLSEYEVANIIYDLAKALEFLHKNRIAHRDLKPANILCKDGNFASPCKIADFDLASAECLKQGTDAKPQFNDSELQQGAGFLGTTPEDGFLGSTPTTDRANQFKSQMDTSETHVSPKNITPFLGMSEMNPVQSSQVHSNLTVGSPPRVFSDASSGTSSSEDENCSSQANRRKKKTNFLEVSRPMEMTSPVGSPEYMPPEIATLFMFDNIAHLKYTQACDIWSLGVIAYVALSGQPPFYAGKCGNDNCKWNQGGSCNECQEALFEDIYHADLHFPDTPGYKWSSVSDQAKHLIIRCLDRDQDNRITAREILAHPFIQQLTSEDPEPSAELGTSAESAMKCDEPISQSPKEREHIGFLRTIPLTAEAVTELKQVMNREIDSVIDHDTDSGHGHDCEFPSEFPSKNNASAFVKFKGTQDNTKPKIQVSGQMSDANEMNEEDLEMESLSGSFNFT